jgi:hypothetical protein
MTGGTDTEPARRTRPNRTFDAVLARPTAPDLLTTYRAHVTNRPHSFSLPISVTAEIAYL